MNNFTVEYPQTVSDIKLSANGKTLANVNSCRVISYRDGKLIAPERETEAYGTALGMNKYRLELSRIQFAGDKNDFYSLSNFTVTVKKPNKTVTFSGCNWVEITENYSPSGYLIEKATLLARSRVSSEGGT